MKKYFYSVLAASMLFACSQEDIVDVTKGEGQMKTFKVEIPKVESRTVGGFEIGAGVQADNLIYAMYENGKEEVLISGVVTDGDNGADDGTFTVTVPMAKDLKYDLLFLAYNASNSAFNIASDAKETDLKALQFKDKQTANIDAFDAFVGSLKAHGVADANDVTLKRPFAQINAATSAEDMKNATTLKLDVTKSSLVIKGVPASYNVLEGTASSNTIDVTYAANTIPVCDEATTDPKNEQLSVDGTNYYYLTLAYVLAGEVTTTSTHNATFQFLREDGTSSVSTLEIVSLPIQRNYRTNVIGDLLTKSEEYTIKIDANFGGKHNYIIPSWDGETTSEPEVVNGKYIIKTPAEFAWLAAPKSLEYDVELAANIDMSGHTFAGILSNGKAFDGQGYTLSNVTLDYTSQGQDWSSLFVTGGGNGNNSNISVKDLTIVGANVVAKKSGNGNAAVIASYAEGTVNIENVVVKNSTVNGTLNMGALVGIVTKSGEVTVKDCAVEGVELKTFDLANESGNVGVVAGRVVGKLTVENTSIANSTINAYINRSGQQRAVSKYIGNFYGDGASLVVTNGSINNVKVNILSQENTDQVGIYGDYLGGWQTDGGTVTINGVTFEKDQAASPSIVTTADGLKTALEAAQNGATIGISGNIATTALNADAGNNITIVGMSDDATLDFTSDNNYSDCSGNITFKNLTIKLASNRDHYSVGIHNQGGKHVYEGCKFEGIATAWGDCTYIDCEFTNETSGKYAAWVYLGTVVYENCTFTGVDRAAKVFNENSESNMNVTYNNCTFKASTANKTAVEVAVENNTNVATVVTIKKPTLNNMGEAEHYGTKVFNIEYYNNGKFGNGIVTVDGDTYAVASKEAAIKQALAMDAENITMMLSQDASLNNGTETNWGGTTTKTVKIGSISSNNDLKWTLTLSNNYRDYIKTSGGKVVLENIKLASSEDKSGTHWHNYAPKFNCDVEMDGVDMLNSFCFEKNAVLNNVKVTCDWPTSVYGMWITSGANVTIDGLTLESDRGIKITDEDAPEEKTTLKVSNATFKTSAKAAILATTKHGADITLSNINLENVTADQKNAVWVDEDYASYYDKVNVTGGTKKQE